MQLLLGPDTLVLPAILRCQGPQDGKNQRLELLDKNQNKSLVGLEFYPENDRDVYEIPYTSDF